MDRYCSLHLPYQSAPGQAIVSYLPLNEQDRREKEWQQQSFGASSELSSQHMNSRGFAPLVSGEYYCRPQDQHAQKGSRWMQPYRVPTLIGNAFTNPHLAVMPAVKAQNGHGNIYQQLPGDPAMIPAVKVENGHGKLGDPAMIPAVEVENGHGKIHQQLPGDGKPHSQPQPKPNPPYLAVEDHEQRQSQGTKRERREYPYYSPAEESRGFKPMGLIREKGDEEEKAWRKFQAQMHSGPGAYFSPQAEDARIRQMIEQQKLARKKCEEQKREQEKAQLPAAKLVNSCPEPSRPSGPIRAVHDDNMERRTMSNPTSSTHLQSEAFRRYLDDKARKKEDERRKAAVSAPTPVPARTESVKQLLSNVNKALEQKVEAAELEAVDEACSKSEALQAQSQQLQQQHQSDANQAAHQCGKSFWREYTVNFPRVGCSSVTAPSPQKANSPSAQPPIAEPGCLEGEEDLADRIRFCLRRSSAEESLQMNNRRAATDKAYCDLVERAMNASGPDEPSSPEFSPVVSTSPDGATSPADGPQVSLASPTKVLSDDVSEDQVSSSLPTPPQASEISIGLEVRVGEGDVENVGETAGPFGDVDLESEWEAVDGDDDLGGDEGWCDVEGDVRDEYDARRETCDLEWASDARDDYRRFLGM